MQPVMRSAATKEHSEEWMDAPLVTNGGGEICRRDDSKPFGCSTVNYTGDLNPDERRFIDRVMTLFDELHSASFRVYSYYTGSAGPNRIFLQIEFINFADDTELWKEIDELAIKLGAVSDEMDRGPDADDEKREYVHMELLWCIDAHTVGDAKALRDRINKEVTDADLWKRAGNLVY